MKKTHKEIIYNFLKAHEGVEFNHRLIIDSRPYGLGISEYSGRFSNLREDFHCSCGEKNAICTATEHIINTRKNYYKYIGISTTPSVEVKEQPISQKLISLQVENRLQKYRMMWTKAKNEKNVKEMDRIALMARTCALALHTKPTQSVQVETESNLFKAAREVLL